MIRPAAIVPLLAAALSIPSPAGRAADPAFARFVDDYFDARFAYHPNEGTAAGLHQYDHRLDDFSRARTEARIDTLKAQLARLGTIERGAFSADDAIDAELLDGQIRAELLDL